MQSQASQPQASQPQVSQPQASQPQASQPGNMVALNPVEPGVAQWLSASANAMARAWLSGRGQLGGQYPADADLSVPDTDMGHMVEYILQSGRRPRGGRRSGRQVVGHEVGGAEVTRS